eukprot:TRINITY_DN256_c0_g2_i3.p2 TRINITY_DN256_c0_g2~~TRINITY_DN256_c0_g2_i3.p2  ORF type:complete len:176 (+),score=41.50 TRINITY_DN256_c0_g2_i3:486-1013(+)
MHSHAYTIIHYKNGCTLREASILGSVLMKMSVPVVHSSIALIKFAEMEYTGATSIFMTILLNKKYSLPVRVVNAIVNHFLRFQDETRPLPVLWHKGLLTFIALYHDTLSEMQLEGMKELIKRKKHHQITPEILKILDPKSKNDLIKQNLDKSFNKGGSGMQLEQALNTLLSIIEL